MPPITEHAVQFQTPTAIPTPVCETVPCGAPAEFVAITAADSMVACTRCCSRLQGLGAILGFDVEVHPIGMLADRVPLQLVK